MKADVENPVGRKRLKNCYNTIYEKQRERVYLDFD